jgi:hypothetical protein
MSHSSSILHEVFAGTPRVQVWLDASQAQYAASGPQIHRALFSAGADLAMHEARASSMAQSLSDSHATVGLTADADGGAGGVAIGDVVALGASST